MVADLDADVDENDELLRAFASDLSKIKTPPKPAKNSTAPFKSQFRSSRLSQIQVCLQ